MLLAVFTVVVNLNNSLLETSVAILSAFIFIKACQAIRLSLSISLRIFLTML
jgi:hypothetical protein